MCCWTMKQLTLVAILAVTVPRSLTAKGSVNRSGLQRSEGLTLNDWCIKGEAGLQCEMINGAECVDDRAGVVPFPWAHVCKCANSFEEYSATGGVARCRMKPTAVSRLTGVSCQIDEDCVHVYSKATCNVGFGGRPGKCGCPTDFVVNPANPKVCKTSECTTDNDCVSAFSPDSICNKNTGGKAICVCRGNFLLDAANANVNSGRPVCRDFRRYACDSRNRPCPAYPGLYCDTGTSRCTCPPTFSLQAVSPTSAECKMHTPKIGGICSTDSECPVNGECLTFASLGRKVCMCKAYFRTSSDKRTCQSILGRCCESDADCLVAKLPALSGGTVGGALRCLKSSPGAERGSCACDSGKVWDWNSVNSANVVTPACTSASTA